MLPRRLALSALLLVAAALLGCAAPGAAPDAATRSALAPTGALRVGVYAGSPTSLVRNARGGEPAGLAYELGGALARRLGVPVQLVEFNRVAQVVEALKAGEVDCTFTNASESRAREVDFTQPLLRLELGYLVVAESPITSVDQIDRSGVRVGVTQGSTSQGVLTRQYQHASVVPVASLQAVQEQLQQHRIDAFATNKGILFELSDSLPQARVLPGSWGFEALALAVPQGRQQAMPYLQRFGQDMMESGQLQSMVQRAGLRGTAPR